MKLPPLPSVKNLLNIYNIKAKQQLGQHFILDPNTAAKFARTVTSNYENSLVLEVGPGVGSLTRGILQAGASRVVAVEKDPLVLPTLNQLKDASEDRLNIIPGDILKVDPALILNPTNSQPPPDVPNKLHIVGNLPFNIASPLISRWMDDMAARRGLFTTINNVEFTLLVQREFGERMASKERGRLSILVESLCHVKLAYYLPSEAFVPAPKVEGCVVKMVQREQPLLDRNVSTDTLRIVTTAAFNQRRKKLRTSLTSRFSPELVSQLLQQVDVDPDVRAVNLPTEKFCQMAKVLQEMEREGKLEKDMKLWRLKEQKEQTDE
ncbi:Dimethyladenosine transferase 1, mitochondrial [Borealophlyctis nickersoniae]|nr:Dimethyladenosine transferase 1, mitochondrial [Borealophlyctis nickersoniae]